MLLTGLILSWLQFNCNPASSSPAVAVDMHKVLLVDLHQVILVDLHQVLLVDLHQIIWNAAAACHSALCAE